MEEWRVMRPPGASSAATVTAQWPSCLTQKFHASAGIRSPNVIRAHGFEDRLVGIAQKRSGFGTLMLARQRFAEAARKDCVLNIVAAMLAIELEGTSKLGLSQFKFSGGHVDLGTQLIKTC